MKLTAILLATLLPAFSGAAAGPATGRGSATASATVGLRIPSLHGADVAAGSPSSSVRLASRRMGAAPVAAVRLSLVNTNGTGSFEILRLLAPGASSGAPVSPAAYRKGARQAPIEPAESARASRKGAFGWKTLEDAVPVPERALVSRGSEPVSTVAYEIWQF